MSQIENIQEYFKSDHFAVVGNFDDPNKFPYWILGWYVTKNLPVTPIARSASGGAKTWVAGKDLANVKSVKELPDPANTSLNVVTGPWFTKQILADAKEVGIRRVWLQPGTYDAALLDYAKTNFDAGIGGTDGGKGQSGWCVLVDGDDGMRAVGKL